MKRRLAFFVTMVSLIALLVGVIGVATVEASKKKGSEGCTPGFWKQSQHFDSWQGYSPNQLFSSVFEDAFPGKTLLQVLSQPASASPGPNSLNNLGRQTVAALLNVASGGVDYPYNDVSAVINQFNSVFPGGDYEGLKDIFEGFNQLGCPLS
jgi:hypothetical protein